jgi:DNA-binding transcriptional MerR regulator
MDKLLMPLSEITNILNQDGMKLNKSKLYHYFRLGLLIPESTFVNSKTILFDFKDVKHRLKIISELNKKGYKLTEIVHKLT